MWLFVSFGMDGFLEFPFSVFLGFPSLSFLFIAGMI